jgi:hypothetical protein
MTRTRRGDEGRATILLKDLDPDRDVRGGAGKRLFGEQAETSEAMRESSGSEDRKPVVRAQPTKKTSR